MPASAASIWPVWLQSSSMACLPRMTSCRAFLVDEGLEQLGHGQRLQFDLALDQDGAVGADGHGGAQGLLALRDAAGHGNDLGDHALFLQAHGLFDGDFVERVHAHLDVGDVHTGAVALTRTLTL
jgi:hypothetical protein